MTEGYLLCIRVFFSVLGHDFLHKLVHGLRYKWDAILNIFMFEAFAQKYDSYRNYRKKWVLYFKYCTRAARWIIFYNVFSDNVNNLYESILLIISFLFFFVGKVLVANEKNLRNNLYLTDNVSIFVENVPGTTEKILEWGSRFLLLRSALALIREFVLDSPDSHLKSSLALSS